MKPETKLVLTSALAGLVLGVIATFNAVSWRIGAHLAARDLYAVGAAKAFDQLASCQQPVSPWPRKPPIRAARAVHNPVEQQSP